MKLDETQQYLLDRGWKLISHNKWKYPYQCLSDIRTFTDEYAYKWQQRMDVEDKLMKQLNLKIDKSKVDWSYAGIPICEEGK